MKTGDPVTIALLTRLVPGRVKDVDQTYGFFRAIIKLVTVGDTEVARNIDGEGAEWCRGHKGRAVRALRAAQALR